MRSILHTVTGLSLGNVGVLFHILFHQHVFTQGLQICWAQHVFLFNNLSRILENFAMQDWPLFIFWWKTMHFAKFISVVQQGWHSSEGCASLKVTPQSPPDVSPVHSWATQGHREETLSTRIWEILSRVALILCRSGMDGWKLERDESRSLVCAYLATLVSITLWPPLRLANWEKQYLNALVGEYFWEWSPMWEFVRAFVTQK